MLDQMFPQEVRSEVGVLVSGIQQVVLQALLVLSSEEWILCWLEADMKHPVLEEPLFHHSPTNRFQLSERKLDL